MAGKAVQIKQVSPKGLVIGEGPHWVKGRQYLLFVDIHKGEMHRLFTETGRHQVLRVEPEESGHIVSFIIPVANHRDLFVIGHGRSFSLVEWPESDPDSHTKKVKATLHTVEGHMPKNSLNDGKCDPQGRLWSGTYGAMSGVGQVESEKGHIYCLKNDLAVECWADKITISNGMGWSNDHKTFYYVDSMAYSVDAFDYDDATGKIGNRRKMFDFKAENLTPDIPDGMCVDSNGDVWVACFSGGKVIRINPATGKVIQAITMPTKNVTSACFGGPDLDILYVTSATYGMTPEQKEKDPAGATFAVTGLGVTGKPPVEFRIDAGVLKQKLG